MSTLRASATASICGASFPCPGTRPDWLQNPDFLDQVLQQLSPQDYVVVVCTNGDISFKAAARLEQAGFCHEYTILGGYEDVRRARRTGVSGDGRGMRFRVRRTWP